MSHTNGTPARSNGKHPGGRPSKYDPAYCQRIVEFFAARAPYCRMRDGVEMSDPVWMEDFADAIGVNGATVADWAVAHPEFNAACKKAMSYQARHLSLYGLRKPQSTGMAIFLLKNNHGYRDRQPDETANVNVTVSVTMIEGLKAAAVSNRLESVGVNGDPHP